MLNIILRDLKLQNIMVSFDSKKDKEELNMMKAKIKIIDFSFAICLLIEDYLSIGPVGRLMCMEPKLSEEFYKWALLDKNRGCGKEVDIWFLGCICYELYRGKPPFEAKTSGEMKGKLNNGKFKLPKTASFEIYSFLVKMLQNDAKARLSARKLINQPFLTKDPKTFSRIQIDGDTKQIKKEKSNINLYKYDSDSTKKNNTYPENQIKEVDNLNKSKNKTFDKNNTYAVVTPLIKPKVQSGAVQSTTIRFQPIIVPIQQNIQAPIILSKQMPVHQVYQQPLQQSYQQTYQKPIKQNYQQSLQQTFQPICNEGGIPFY